MPRDMLQIINDALDPDSYAAPLYALRTGKVDLDELSKLVAEIRACPKGDASEIDFESARLLLQTTYLISSRLNYLAGRGAINVEEAGRVAEGFLSAVVGKLF